MGLLAPDAPISASWQDHKNRNPPSSEPGTDYATAYGVPVAAAGDGIVTEIKTSTSGGTGRFVQMRLSDGREYRPLHLSEIWVSVGAHVSRGQLIGLSGASGYNSNFYYGPHVHCTLWNGDAWAAPTIDFELYVSPEPDPEPDPIIEEENEMAVRYVIVTREDAPLFGLLGPDPADARRTIMQGIGNDAQRRGAQKVVDALNGEETPSTILTGEEWDSGALGLFQPPNGAA